MAFQLSSLYMIISLTCLTCEFESIHYQAIDKASLSFHLSLQLYIYCDDSDWANRFICKDLHFNMNTTWSSQHKNKLFVFSKYFAIIYNTHITAF